MSFSLLCVWLGLLLDSIPTRLFLFFFSLLLINITPLPPPLILHQARPSIHAQIKPENYLVQMGQTRKRQKCRHFPEEEKNNAKFDSLENVEISVF
jgi:hypothetical protein